MKFEVVKNIKTILDVHSLNGSMYPICMISENIVDFNCEAVQLTEYNCKFSLEFVNLESEINISIFGKIIKIFLERSENLTSRNRAINRVERSLTNISVFTLYHENVKFVQHFVLRLSPIGTQLVMQPIDSYQWHRDIEIRSHRLSHWRLACI